MVGGPSWLPLEAAPALQGRASVRPIDPRRVRAGYCCRPAGGIQATGRLRAVGSRAVRPRVVLLGGPGAGKSTWVKSHVLSWSHGRPFFLRLRDLPSDQDVVGYLTRAAERSAIPEPGRWIADQLSTHTTLVVLDGLDEVRSSDWDDVCRQINDFAKTYALVDGGITLIVTCRKEAFRTIPIGIPDVREVRPLTDQQIERFAEKWPPGFPRGKSAETFLRDLRGSERVLEVARSPLMLVGALMQYTESNLGIPDERKDYLERIARWLLEDWGKAQGHPADEWRKAYERVLEALALEMHSRRTAEISRDEGARVIRETLPKVGYDGGKTDQFIERLATKTGILVRDIPGVLVFAQFSLQEYFASRAVASALGPKELAELPMDWWREAVLLAVSQQANPDDYFEALFKSDALLGIASVAEYPTPPLIFQGRAIDSALDAIDRGVTAVSDATVTLTRKVEGRHERNLVEGLEARLQHDDDDVASEAGRVLALSGRPSANEALGRNPGGWKRTLRKVGYLSTSFEDMLVTWLRGKNEQQASAASEVLLSRLSEDRRDQLVGLLDDIPADRAATLADGLIKSFDGRHMTFWAVNRDIFRVACHCAPHLTVRPRRSRPPFFDEPGVMIAHVARALMDQGGRTPRQALGTLVRSANWAMSRRAILWTLASAVVAIGTGLPGVFASAALAIGAVVAGVTCFLAPITVPWFPIRAGSSLDTPLAFVGGGALMAAASVRADFFSAADGRFWYLAASVILVTLALRSGHEAFGSPRSLGDGLDYLDLVLKVWAGCLVAAMLAQVWWPVAAGAAISTTGLVLASLAIIVAVRTGVAGRVVRRARERVFESDDPVWIGP